MVWMAWYVTVRKLGRSHGLQQSQLAAVCRSTGPRITTRLFCLEIYQVSTEFPNLYKAGRKLHGSGTLLL